MANQPLSVEAKIKIEGRESLGFHSHHSKGHCNKFRWKNFIYAFQDACPRSSQIWTDMYMQGNLISDFLHPNRSKGGLKSGQKASKESDYDAFQTLLRAIKALSQ